MTGPPGRNTRNGPALTAGPPAPEPHRYPAARPRGFIVIGTADIGPDATGRGLADAVTLPYDQIAAERRTIGDATGRLGDQLGVLGVALAQWAARDDSRADAAVRRAASTAIDAIDAMLAELHALRSRLVGEVRESDDLAAERADAILAQTGGDPP